MEKSVQQNNIYKNFFLLKLNALIKKMHKMSVGEAKEFVRNCIYDTKDVIELSDDDVELIKKKVQFVSALKTIILDEFGIDEDKLTIVFNGRSGASKGFFKPFPDAFGDKDLGLVSINSELMLNENYSALAKTIIHELNHFKFYYNLVNYGDRGIKANPYAGNRVGCLLSFFNTMAYWANEEEYVSNMNSHKKVIEILDSFEDDSEAWEERIKDDWIEATASKMTDSVTYRIGTALGGKIYSKILSNVVNHLVEKSRNVIGKYNIVHDNEYLEDTINDFLLNGKDMMMSYKSSKEKEDYLEKVLTCLFELRENELGVNRIEYVMTMDSEDESDVSNIKFVDLAWVLKNSGVKSSMGLKYQVLIPSRYWILPPEIFCERVNEDLDAIIAKKKLFEERSESEKE